MKNRLFLALLPLLAACGGSSPTLNLDSSIIAIDCSGDRAYNKAATLTSRDKRNYVFSRDTNELWLPTRCATHYSVYFSSNARETMVPINVIDWKDVPLPKYDNALPGDPIVGPSGVYYTYFIEWRW